MSDYYVSFIPVNPNYVPVLHVANQIENLIINHAQGILEINNIVLLAHAGENLESISCHLCKADLKEWWGDAMDSAYSKENGFVELIIQTPCCHQTCSLNDLDYYFPQGFYKTKLTFEPNQRQLDTKLICQRLMELSALQWRVIHTRI